MIEASGPKLIVVTGGPGAGKTAALEVVRREACPHLAVLREAASIVFGGGFPRSSTLPSQRAAQRAIFRVQRELERLTIEEGNARIILCDRGTLDGLAYWPGAEAEFFHDLETSLEVELARYAMVIRLKTPAAHHGYNHDNPLRVETARQAAAIDERIARVWGRHPRVVTVDCKPRFLDKLHAIIDVIRGELPKECRDHHLDLVDLAAEPLASAASGAVVSP
jgi:predicted ATPase